MKPEELEIGFQYCIEDLPDGALFKIQSDGLTFMKAGLYQGNPNKFVSISICDGFEYWTKKSTIVFYQGMSDNIENKPAQIPNQPKEVKAEEFVPDGFKSRAHFREYCYGPLPR